MFQTLTNVFKIPELRNKILFTLAMLFVFRVGHWIPVPGSNQEAIAKMMQKATQESSTVSKVAEFVAMFSGGALSHSTVFGLGIMPYITAGIIFQILATVMPQLKKLQEEGPTGRQKIQEWTRYTTVALCFVQAVTWLKFLTSPSNQLIYPQWSANPLWWLMAILILTAGTIFLMWLGEQIDRFGVGNGVSMIIMAGILTNMPAAVQKIKAQWGPGEPDKMGYMGLILLALGFVVVVAGAVLMTVAQRRIPIQQAKHTRGRRVFGGQRSYLPLRLNHGGVMPIIFANSLMVFPSLLFSALHNMSQGGNGWWVPVTQTLSNWFTNGEFLFVICEMAMIYFFSYFWINVQFNPEEMAKQLKEHGSFIPGLRPGPRTAEYLETVVSRVTFVGAAFLCVVASIPMVVHKAFNVDFMVTQFLGGTGLLIVVSVCLDFLQRVEANLLMRNYQGFLSTSDDGRGPRLAGARAM